MYQVGNGFVNAELLSLLYGEYCRTIGIQLFFDKNVSFSAWGASTDNDYSCSGLYSSASFFQMPHFSNQSLLLHFLQAYLRLWSEGAVISSTFLVCRKFRNISCRF